MLYSLLQQYMMLQYKLLQCTMLNHLMLTHLKLDCHWTMALHCGSMHMQARMQFTCRVVSSAVDRNLACSQILLQHADKSMIS